MRPRLIVIAGIHGQNPPQMPRAEDEKVIHSVSPQRSDQPFGIRVLPGRAGRYWSVSDPHRPNPPPKDRAVSAIIVAHQIGRCRLPREGLDNLLRQRWLPSRLRLPRDTYSGSDEQMFGAK